MRMTSTDTHSFSSFNNEAIELAPNSIPSHWNMAPSATSGQVRSQEKRQADGRRFQTPTGEVMTQLDGHQYVHNVFNVFGDASRERAISSTRRHVEMREISFDEASEDRESVLRKRVLPNSTIGWTRNCVVLDQRNLPDYLFTDLSLIDKKGWLVEDFSYEKLEKHKEHDWKIIYNRGDVIEKNDYGYVKVITKNSYWAELLWTLLKGGMVFAMTEYSHFAFMNSLPFERPKKVMLICWIVFIFLRIVAATLSAQYEWQADAESGPDIIRESTSHLSPEEEARIHKQTPLTSGTEPLPKMAFARRARPAEQWRAFLALIIFQLVGVPGVLRDITVFLHPWKGLQPYAAFKADGARAYLLGFPHGSLYRIENRPRHEMRYFLTFCMTLVMTCIKVRVRCPQLDVFIQLDENSEENESGYSIYSLIIELFPSVLTMLISVFGLFRLVKSKRRCRQWLEEQLHSPDVKQQQVAQRLLKKHFGIYFKQTSITAQTSIAAASNMQAQDQEALKQCSDRCAELARELQLWQVDRVFADQLKRHGVDLREAQRFLCALRDIAGPTLPRNDSLRGPSTEYCIVDDGFSPC